jgi:hypothetical protein
MGAASPPGLQLNRNTNKVPAFRLSREPRAAGRPNDDASSTTTGMPVRVLRPAGMRVTER